MKLSDWLGKKETSQEITKESLREIYKSVNEDDLCGLGDISKLDHFLDKVLAFTRIAIAQAKGVPVRAPTRMFREPTAVEVASTSPVALASAKAAKAAE